MRAGSLTKRIIIERLAATKDAFGQADEAWTEIASRRASVEPMTGAEYIAANSENAKVTTKITIRLDDVVSVVTSRDRIQSDGVIYDIKSVINPLKRGEYIEMICEAIK